MKKIITLMLFLMPFAASSQLMQPVKSFAGKSGGVFGTYPAYGKIETGFNSDYYLLTMPDGLQVRCNLKDMYHLTTKTYDDGTKWSYYYKDDLYLAVIIDGIDVTIFFYNVVKDAGFAVSTIPLDNLQQLSVDMFALLTKIHER